MLLRSPVDLVLHGHLHYPTSATLDGPSGPIPVLGAASASAVGKRKSVAHYHVIEIETEAAKLQISVQHYHYNTETGSFYHSGTQSL